MTSTDKLTPSEYIKSLDLSAFPQAIADNIRKNFLTNYENTDLIGEKEFEMFKSLVESEYPKALGLKDVRDEVDEELPPVVKPIVEEPVNKPEGYDELKEVFPNLEYNKFGMFFKIPFKYANASGVSDKKLIEEARMLSLKDIASSSGYSIGVGLIEEDGDESIYSIIYLGKIKRTEKPKVDTKKEDEANKIKAEISDYELLIDFVSGELLEDPDNKDYKDYLDLIKDTVVDLKEELKALGEYGFGGGIDGDRGNIANKAVMVKINIPAGKEYCLDKDNWYFGFREFLSNKLTKKWFGHGAFVIIPLSEYTKNEIKLEIQIPAGKEYCLDKANGYYDFSQFISKALTEKWFGHGVFGVEILREYKDGGAVGKKYKSGDFVFAKIYKDESNTPPFIVAYVAAKDEYYIMGDGSHYVKESKLSPATEKDFDDYYGEEVAESFKREFRKPEYAQGGSVGGARLYRFVTSEQKGLKQFLLQSQDGLSHSIHKGYIVAVRKPNDQYNTMFFRKTLPVNMSTVLGYAPYPNNTSENVVVINNDINEKFAKGGNIDGKIADEYITHLYSHRNKEVAETLNKLTVPYTRAFGNTHINVDDVFQEYGDESLKYNYVGYGGLYFMGNINGKTAGRLYYKNAEIKKEIEGVIRVLQMIADETSETLATIHKQHGQPKTQHSILSMRATKYAKGGYVGKGELVWGKITSSEKSKFLYENFTPEITPRSQEALVGKAYNFLPSKVKIVLNSKYANIEEYAQGGSTIRANNSPLLKYANFEDNWHINLIELNPYKNLQKGLTYKNGNKYAVVRSSVEKGQEVFEFKTLEKAEAEFNKLVNLGKTYSKVEKEGTTKNYTDKYANGGGIEKDSVLERIASLIRKGEDEGGHPSWFLTTDGDIDNEDRDKIAIDVVLGEIEGAVKSGSWTLNWEDEEEEESDEDEGRYEVIVGNIGNVIRTNNEQVARESFNKYVEISKEENGRVSGEDVTLFDNGEPIEEYFGTLRDNDDDESDEVDLEGKYLYRFNEERGELTASVEQMSDGETVWEMRYPDFSLNEEDRDMQSSMVDDGFMKNWDDIKGLETYLKDMSVIPDDAEIINESQANNDYDYYKEGGSIYTNPDITTIIISNKAPLMSQLEIIGVDGRGGKHSNGDIFTDSESGHKFTTLTVEEAKELDVHGLQLPSEGAVHGFFEEAKEKGVEKTAKRWNDENLLTGKNIWLLSNAFTNHKTFEESYKTLKDSIKKEFEVKSRVSDTFTTHHEKGGNIEGGEWKRVSSISFKTKKEAQNRFQLLKNDKEKYRNPRLEKQDYGDKLNDGYVVKYDIFIPSTTQHRQGGAVLANGKTTYEKGDEGMYGGNEVRVLRYAGNEYTIANLDDGDISLLEADIRNIPLGKFEHSFVLFPKINHKEGGKVNGKILKQNSTHKAVSEDGKIKIYIKGFEIDDLKVKDEYLYSIPLKNKDDLFDIFERFDEDNRINRAEANGEFKKGGSVEGKNVFDLNMMPDDLLYAIYESDPQFVYSPDGLVKIKKEANGSFSLVNEDVSASYTFKENNKLEHIVWEFCNKNYTGNAKPSKPTSPKKKSKPSAPKKKK